MNDPLEWVKVNRHLQTVGTATCDVSSLIFEANMLVEEKNSRAAFFLMCAARDVLRHRRLARHRPAPPPRMRAVRPHIQAERRVRRFR